MIPYDAHNYNCAHYAIEQINVATGADITFKSGDEWQVDFIRYLRANFTRINKPTQNCLVVMSQHTGGLHLGVYRDYAVSHNYNSMFGAGSVIKSDLGTIRANYKRIRFYDYNHKTP